MLVKVTERTPRQIFGSTPSTGNTTPVLASASISQPLAQALKRLDPLTELALFEEMDPLSRLATETDVKLDHRDVVERPTISTTWSSRKAAILQKYTTSEKLCMVTSFLSEGEKGG